MMKLANKKDILNAIKKTYDYALETLQNFDESQLSEKVKFFAGPMTKLQIINLLSNHQTHHRGQMLIYLRLKGKKPPKFRG